MKQGDLRKCLGYFEIKSLDNPCFSTRACNPKENYEFFENSYVNKKHKRVKKVKKESPAMNFENYADRLVSLTYFDIFEKPPADYKEVSQLTGFQGKIQGKTVTKTKFSQFNDKRFYFSDGITSLPLSHPYLKELVEFKTKTR